MNVEWVQRKVANIERESHDPESAHAREDELLYAVLAAIADGRAEDPRAVAAEAMKAGDVSFPRWYA